MNVGPLSRLRQTVSRTNADYLRWKLGKWAREYAPNIKVVPEGSQVSVPLESNEHAIAEISLASSASPIVVSDTRLVREGETLLRYDQVEHCIWIDRDREMKGMLKHSHFQRMILERSDGSELILDGLGQAVFPLLQFFWFKLGRGEPTAG
jgi:hypothetical protein